MPFPGIGIPPDAQGFASPVNPQSSPIPPPTPEYLAGLLGPQMPPSPFMPSGPGMDIPQPTPGPTFVDVPPPRPPQDFIDAVWDYIPPLLSHSRRFVKGYEDKWEKWLWLWRDELNLEDWRNWPHKSAESTDHSRAGISRNSTDGEDVWESQYTHSPGYMVDQYADRAYPMIFGGPEWFSVISQDATQLSTDDEFPSNRKMQEHMGRLFLQGKIHARTYELLFLNPLIGSVFAKVFWYEHTVPKWQQSTVTGNVYETDEVVYECPIIQAIPPDRILVDPKALDNDVQRWRFVGHRVEMSYDQIIEGYESGLFDLNRDKFEKRWTAKGGSAATEEEESILTDDESTNAEPADDTTMIDLWEWHAKIPYKSRLREAWGIIATEKGAETCEDGIQVKVSQAPLLRSTGMRPIVCAHFQQYTGPFGIGMFDRLEKALYSISQFVAQFEDCAKNTADPMWWGGPGFIREMAKHENKTRPGLIIPRTIGEEKPEQLAPLHFDYGAIQTQIQFLQGWIQRRSTVSDPYMGMASNADSATEAQIQQQQGAAPATTKTDLFTRDFFEPLLNIALAFTQQLSFDDKQIAFVGADGAPKQVTITEDELKRGRYSIVATLTRQDTNSLAKAQSVERILPILQKLEQNLVNEGVMVSYSEIIKRYADLIGLEGADRIVRVISSREQVLMQQVQELLGRLQEIEAQMPPSPKQPQGQPPEGPPENEGPNPELPPGSQGGPIGPTPSDANQEMLALQMQHMDNNPEVY